MKKETAIVLVILIIVIGAAVWYFTKTAKKTVDKTTDTVDKLAAKSGDIKGSLDDISHIADVINGIVGKKSSPQITTI